MSKTALITGITGQDGAYLAELLLGKGYVVHGIKRRTSLFNTDRIDHLYEEPHVADRRLVLHHGDLTDSSSLVHVMQQVQPDEVYNLGAQSHVAVSFEEPEYTANSDAMGTLRLLEAIRILGFAGRTRFYQASTSEMFGARQGDAAEGDHAVPSALAVRRRQALRALDHGQLPRVVRHVSRATASCSTTSRRSRGETFVTRKITRALTRIVLGLQDCLYLGNLDARRDWGHAKDYVRAMWLMLQQPAPEDYVIATGEQHSVRDFVDAAAAELGVALAWQGAGPEEIGRVATIGADRQTALAPGQTIVRIDRRYFRPAEVDTLLGDATKARTKLGWIPEVRFPDLVAEMVREDLRTAQRDELVKRHGHAVQNRNEG